MKKSIAYVLMAGIMLGFSACAASEEAVYEVPVLLEPVGVRKDTAVAAYGEILDATVYRGEVVPEVTELYFTADGKVDEVLVQYGDMVEEGQELVRLDDEQLREEIEALEEKISEIKTLGEFSTRTAEADIWIARYERDMMLNAGAAQEKCDAKEYEIQILEAKLGHAQQLRNLELAHYEERLTELKRQLDEAVLKAPFAGKVVYITTAREGTAVKGYTPVICLADETQKSISAEFIYEYVAQEAADLYARIGDRDYDISFVPYDKDAYVAMALNSTELKASFRLEEGADELECGAFAAVVVCHDYKQNALIIPANALYKDASGWYVYKVVDGQNVRCAVETGLVTDASAEITKGLAEGDEVYVKE